MRIRNIMLALVAVLATTALVAGPALAHKKHDNHTKLTGGTTTLVVPDATLAALTNYTVDAVAPATKAGSTFSFPITKGQFNERRHNKNFRSFFGRFAKRTAAVKHDGGLTLTKGTTTVKVASLRIWVRGRHGVLEGKVNDRGRVAIANLKNVVIANGKGTADATLTGVAARGLNQVFSDTIFTKGAALGVVTVTPTTA